jgi:hypothetical protein
MSHIVTIETEIRDPIALESACRRLDLDLPTHETVTLFNDAATGHAVRLPEWKYPVVCALETGRLHFDNYEGRWGEQRHLDRFVQSYAVEKATLEARKQGHSVYEQPLEDGSLKLTITTGGGA